MGLPKVVRPLALPLVVLGALFSSTLAEAAGSASARSERSAIRVRNGATINWSGYVATSGPYSSVSASWIQPAMDCAETAYGASSFWVGLDGWGSTTVEQAGTEARCTRGVAEFVAWSEMFPKAASRFPTAKYPVSEGDALAASVAALGGGKFKLILRDETKGWSRTLTKKASKSAPAELRSAEVIAEAPSLGGEPESLADFGTVGFGGATVDGQTLTTSLPGVEPLTMVSKAGGVTEAVPSPISGGAFTDTWQSP